MSADTLGQAMMHGGDLDVALEHPKTAFDVGQCLVAGNDFISSESGVGDQQQLAIELLGRPAP